MDQLMYLAVIYVVGVKLLNSCHGYPVDLHLSDSSASEVEGAGAWRGSSAWPFLLGCGSLLSSALLLAACLCCRRSSKGFQEFTDSTSTHSLHEAGSGSGSGSGESAGVVNCAAANGGAGVTEVTLFPPPVATGRSSVVRFDPLPDIKSPVPGAAPAPAAGAAATSAPAASCRPAAFSNALSHGLSAHDWFENPHDNFPRSHLKYVKELGHGWFGRAVEGEAFGITPGQDTTRVVVKILHEDATATDHMFFLHEVRPYRDLNHPNVLRLLGRCLETDPFLIVLEACSSGDLKSFLSQNISTADALSQQGVTLSMCNQVAAGLLYMHQHGFVHTDLAARNCLVTSDLTVKIGDYGTSIDIFKEDYYCTSDVALPIRWCAPESLLCTDTTIETKEVTTSANVWSLGVVFWEICEFGKLPYEELTDEEVIVKVLVESSQYLSFPSRTSPFQHNLYRLMKSCWSPVSERPYLPQVLAMLNHLYENYKAFNENDGSGNLKRNIDFEKRWESLKPNSIPITDNHIVTSGAHPPTPIGCYTSDGATSVLVSSNISSAISSPKTELREGVTSPNHQVSLSESFFQASSSYPLATSPQPSLTSSSGGETFIPSLHKRHQSPSLQNLSGSLEDLNECVNAQEESGLEKNVLSQDINISNNDLQNIIISDPNLPSDSLISDCHEPDFDSWLHGVETTDEEDARFVRKISEAIRDLDNALALEKTSSSSSALSSKDESPERSRGEQIDTKSSDANVVLDFRLGEAGMQNSSFLFKNTDSTQPDSFLDESLLEKSLPSDFNNRPGDSGTDTEDEIWRRKIEHGEFTAKVKEKSKSVADLMILTHIECSDGSDSEPPSLTWSYDRGSNGRNSFTKQLKTNNLSANPLSFASESNIHQAVLGEEFRDTLLKLHEAQKDQKTGKSVSEDPVQVESDPPPEEYATSKPSLLEPSNLHNINEVCNVNYETESSHLTKSSSFLVDDASENNSYRTLKDPVPINDSVMSLEESGFKTCEKISPQCSEREKRTENKTSYTGNLSSLKLKNELCANVNEKINNKTEELTSITVESSHQKLDVPQKFISNEVCYDFLQNERSYNLSCSPEENQLNSINENLKKINNENILCISDTSCQASSHNKLLNVLCTNSNSQDTYSCNSSPSKNFKDGLCMEDNPLMIENQNLVEKNDRNIQYSCAESVSPQKYGTNMIVDIIGAGEDLNCIRANKFQSCNNLDEICSHLTESSIVSKVGNKDGETEVIESSSGGTKGFQSYKKDVNSSLCSSVINNAVIVDGENLNGDNFNISPVAYPLESIIQKSSHYLKGTSFFKEKEQLSNKIAFPTLSHLDVEEEYCDGSKLPKDLPSTESNISSPLDENIHTNGIKYSTIDESFSLGVENDISIKCNNLQSSSYKSNKEHLCHLELNIKTFSSDEKSPDTVLKSPEDVTSQNLCVENTLHQPSNEKASCFISGDKKIVPIDSSEVVNDNIGNLDLKHCDKEVHMKIVESINKKDEPNIESEEGSSKNCEGGLTHTILQKENLGNKIGEENCTVDDALAEQDMVSCNMKLNSESNLILNPDISDDNIDSEFGVKIQYKDNEFNDPNNIGESLEVKSNLEGWKHNNDDILNGEFLHIQNHSNLTCEPHYLHLDTHEDFHSEKSENDGILECEEGEEYGVDVAKHSTPDDERSSDSGFRDKGSLSESCEDACDEKYNLEDIEAELEETFSKNKFCYVVKGLSRDEDHTSSEDIPLELCPDQDITSTASGRDTSPCEISSSVSQTVLEDIHRKENIVEDNESSNLDIEMESFPSETENVEARDVHVKESDEFHKVSPSETPDLLNIETNDMPMPDVTSLNNFKLHSCGCIPADLLSEGNFNRAVSNVYCTNVQSNFYQEKDNILDIGQTEFRTLSPDQSSLEDSAESSPIKKSGWFLHSQKNVPMSETNCNESEIFENMSPISSSSSILNEEDSDSNKFDDYGLPLRLNEEFVTAIRNELQEKLPCARKQMDDDNEDDGVLEPEDELMEDERTNITIHYSGYPPPLSPILEERESVSSITTTLSDNFLAKGDQSHESNSEPMSPVFVLDTVDMGTENDSKVFEEEIREALENCSVSSVETDSISEKEQKDRSVIVEDLEKLEVHQSSVSDCEHALPENITIFKSTPPVDFDDDFLVIDMETNHATLLESPKPKSHLAFIKNQVPSGIENNPEISQNSCHCKELPALHSCDQLEVCSKESGVCHCETTYAAVMSSLSQMNVPSTNITSVCESNNESVTSSTDKSLMNSADSLNSQPTSDTNSSSFVDPSLIAELPSVVEQISIGVVNNEAAEILYELEQSGIIHGATNESTEIQSECNVPIGIYCTNLTSSDPVKKDINKDDISPETTLDNIPCMLKTVKQDTSSEMPNSLQRLYLSPDILKNNSICQPSHSLSVKVHKCPSEEECSLSADKDGQDVIHKHHVLQQESVVTDEKDWSEPMLEAAVLSTKAPMPSPEDELWKQIPSMLAFSDLHDMMSRSRSEGDYAESYDVDSPGFQSHDNDDDLMTTSFSLKDSEDVGDCYTPDWESEEDTNEDNSSSSGEFIWKDGDNESFVKAVDIETSGTSKPFEGHSEFAMEMIAEEDEDDEEDDDDDSLSSNSGSEFIPSTWDSEATPSRSALRSPDKKEIQKKNVTFKKQKYHCVYEYPREPSDSESEQTDSPQRRQWDLMNFDVDYASYADWELMDGDVAETSEPDVDTDPEVSQVQPTHTFDIYKLSSVDCDINTDSLSGDGEFYISSSARPFQFSAASSDIFDGNQSEFFPGQLFEDSVTAPLVELNDVSIEFPLLESAIDDKVCKGSVEKASLDPGETEICENINPKENISEPQNNSAHNLFVLSHCFVDGSKTDQVLSADTVDENLSHDLPQSSMSPTMGLGELRHTRDRLKLDLPASCSTFSLDMPATVKKRPVETIRGEASLLDSSDETENSDLESCNGIKFSKSS